ncbi:hypothetical protein F5888DRAFT_1103983 [Russula emetica]|nr:hypothetical protein F5888DRAFT_1103983 [Russula emetica]
MPGYNSHTIIFWLLFPDAIWSKCCQPQLCGVGNGAVGFIAAILPAHCATYGSVTDGAALPPHSYFLLRPPSPPLPHITYHWSYKSPSLPQSKAPRITFLDPRASSYNMFHCGPSSRSQGRPPHLPRRSYFPASFDIDSAPSHAYAVGVLGDLGHPSLSHSFLPPRIDAETRCRRALHELEPIEQEYQVHIALESARQAAAIGRRAAVLPLKLHAANAQSPYAPRSSAPTACILCKRK